MLCVSLYVRCAKKKHKQKFQKTNFKKKKKKGADIIGTDVLLDEIAKGAKPSFDVTISTPQMLKTIVKYGRYLGPLGLIPNPKMGTLTSDPVKAVKEAKQGQVPVRMHEPGAIYGGVGKVSFGEQKLYENIKFGLKITHTYCVCVRVILYVLLCFFLFSLLYFVCVMSFF